MNMPFPSREQVEFIRKNYPPGTRVMLNNISQELMFTYQQQTEYRDRLREQGRESISEIAAKINAGEYLNPRIEELLVQLSDRLSHNRAAAQCGGSCRLTERIS